MLLQDFDDKELMSRVRARFGISWGEADDEELYRATFFTLTYAVVKLKLELQRFGADAKKTFRFYKKKLWRSP